MADQLKKRISENGLRSSKPRVTKVPRSRSQNSQPIVSSRTDTRSSNTIRTSIGLPTRTGTRSNRTESFISINSIEKLNNRVTPYNVDKTRTSVLSYAQSYHSQIKNYDGKNDLEEQSKKSSISVKEDKINEQLKKDRKISAPRIVHYKNITHSMTPIDNRSALKSIDKLPSGMNLRNDYPEELKTKNRRKRKVAGKFWTCSRLCIFFSILAAILIGTAIAAALIYLFNKPSTTTTPILTTVRAVTMTVTTITTTTVSTTTTITTSTTTTTVTTTISTVTTTTKTTTTTSSTMTTITTTTSISTTSSVTTATTTITTTSSTTTITTMTTVSTTTTSISTTSSITTATTTTTTTSTKTTTTTMTTISTTTTSVSTTTSSVSTTTTATTVTTATTTTKTSTTTTTASTTSTTTTTTTTSTTSTSQTTTETSTTSETTTTTELITVTYTPSGIYALQVPTCATWNQTGTTVAGNSNGTAGSDLASLDTPVSIFIDNNYTLYVCDRENHRILKYEVNDTIGTVVAGDGTPGNSPTQLNEPKGVAVTQEGEIIVADSSNYRIQRFPVGSLVGITVAFNSSVNLLGQTRDLHIDVNNIIYVTDSDYSRIVKYYPNNGIGFILAGSAGPGNKSDQLNQPYGNFMDGNQTLFIADFGNHRVQKWLPGATNGTTVAGITGVSGSGLSQLKNPRAVVTDNNGYLYIVDSGNNRVVKWTDNYAAGGICIIGCSGSGSGTNQLKSPRDLKFDASGNLYVSDQGNNRVQKFTIQIPANCTVNG